MRTYFFRTEGIKGPRGGRGHCQAFVVVAPDLETAREQVLARCEPLTTIKSSEVVLPGECLRVQAI
jgi:hypothetical protein